MEIIRPDWHKPPIEVCETAPIPYSHERHFSLRVKGWRVPVVNLRFEAFASVRYKFQDDKVWIKIWTQILSEKEANYWGCVNDGRFPKEILAKSLCWLGSTTPPFAIAKEICDYTELPGLKQFTNPKTYWEARGGVFINGSVSLPG